METNRPGDTGTGRKFARPSPAYAQLVGWYKHRLHRERAYLRAGVFFVLATITLECFVIFHVTHSLAEEMHPPDEILHHASVFALLGVIAFMVLCKMAFVRKWNRGIYRPESSVVRIQYQLIDKTRTIIGITCVLIVLCAAFFVSAGPRKFGPGLSPGDPLVGIPTGLRRFSTGVVGFIAFFEVIQLVKWTRRARAAHWIERLLLKELPNLPANGA